MNEARVLAVVPERLRNVRRSSEEFVIEDLGPADHEPLGVIHKR
jgi:hypothetical protein